MVDYIASMKSITASDTASAVYVSMIILPAPGLFYASVITSLCVLYVIVPLDSCPNFFVVVVIAASYCNLG